MPYGPEIRRTRKMVLSTSMLQNLNMKMSTHSNLQYLKGDAGTSEPEGPEEFEMQKKVDGHKHIHATHNFHALMKYGPPDHKG